MRGTSNASRRAPAPANPLSIDVVILAPRQRQLGVLCDGPALPWGTVGRSETMADAARRIAREAAGGDPLWMEQLGAFGDGTSHPGSPVVSVGHIAVVPEDRLAAPMTWHSLGVATSLPHRHRLMLQAGVEAVRVRMDHAPVAFRLLPSLFTLTDLQQVYELLLGRRLHKASFRRALMASWLVEPTSEWRSEGRGRPAQLFRYATRRRRASRRTVRFDLL